MKYNRLGNTGMKVSTVGMGTNQFGGKVSQKQVDEIVARAIDAGLNFIDTADIYQNGESEKALGKALKGRRKEVILATKVGLPVGEGPNDRGASRKRIMDGVEDSLRRLQTEYIDLYQIHWWDEDTPMEETLEALNDLVCQGKVRYIGVSNWSSWQVAMGVRMCQQHGWTPIASVQPHYHLFERRVEDELVSCCQHLGLGILPYFPLAGGFLTGKYRKSEGPPEGSRGQSSEYVQQFFTDEYFDAMEKLEEFAHKRDYTPAQLAIAWLAAQPQVSSVIAGVTSTKHLKSNLKAAEWEMTEQEQQKIREIAGNLRKTNRD